MAIPSSGQSKILLLANAIVTRVTSLITIHNADSNAHSAILTNYVQTSNTSGLLKNDGTVDNTLETRVSNLENELEDLEEDLLA